MKQRYEIPLPLDEVKERLRADMQTDWPLGKLLRSVKRPANDRRGLYGQIEGERLWAVMMHGYDMYPKRVFFGTLRAQGDHTILEGGFRYPMQVLLKLAVLLAWILFGIIRIGVYTAPALLCEAALCALFFALLYNIRTICSYRRVLRHLHENVLTAADLSRIQNALTFLSPLCRDTREAHEDMMGVPLKTDALLRASR
jgi:hypothetical protein